MSGRPASPSGRRRSSSSRRLVAVVVLAPLLAVGAGPGAAPADLLRLRVRQGDREAVPLATLLGGSPAVVQLWATYCPPCRAEVPALEGVVRRWGDRGVRVLGVALDLGHPERVAQAVRDWGIDYETYWVAADQEDAVEALIPAGLPATFFVGPDGVTRYDRLLSDADLDALVARHLVPR